MNLAEAGAIIREARRRAGLTQAQLARRRGMSRATLSKIETGTVVEIGLRKYVSLCESLGLEFSLGPRPGPLHLHAAYEERDREHAEAAAQTAQILREALP